MYSDIWTGGYSWPKLLLLLRQIKHTLLKSSCLLELAEQSIICPQGEVQRTVFVVVRVGLQVLDDVCQKVSSLHTTARSIVAQLSEVNMKVVVGRLVVQVDSHLTGWKVVALQDGLLGDNETAIITIQKLKSVSGRFC